MTNFDISNVTRNDQPQNRDDTDPELPPKMIVEETKSKNSEEDSMSRLYDQLETFREDNSKVNADHEDHKNQMLTPDEGPSSSSPENLKALFYGLPTTDEIKMTKNYEKKAESVISEDEQPLEFVKQQLINPLTLSQQQQTLMLFEKQSRSALAGPIFNQFLSSASEAEDSETEQAKKQKRI